MNDLKLGALCWNQYTTWPLLLEAGQRADQLGYDTLWTWDHLYPIVGSSDGPILEGWLTLAAWAQATEHVRIGLMVGANTLREPALTAKMATTLDHISGGRAILGIGGAWFEEEHVAYGIPFGSGFPERLRWLGEALPIMRGMLHGERPTASGPRYSATAVRNDPMPIQERLPILIGGGGEQVTLKLVARYGDAGGREESDGRLARSDGLFGDQVHVVPRGLLQPLLGVHDAPCHLVDGRIDGSVDNRIGQHCATNDGELVCTSGLLIQRANGASHSVNAHHSVHGAECVDQRSQRSQLGGELRPRRLLRQNGEVYLRLIEFLYRGANFSQHNRRLKFTVANPNGVVTELVERDQREDDRHHHQGNDATDADSEPRAKHHACTLLSFALGRVASVARPLEHS